MESVEYDVGDIVRLSNSDIPLNFQAVDIRIVDVEREVTPTGWITRKYLGTFVNKQTVHPIRDFIHFEANDVVAFKVKPTRLERDYIQKLIKLKSDLA